MRIISGLLKGRRLTPPKNMPFTRPTTDFAKEALFNILATRFDFENKIGLDLFAGTGNISYEFISRGVKMMTLIEQDLQMSHFIIKNSQEYKINHQIQLLKTDVLFFLKNCTQKFDFIFAGPPYSFENILDLPELVFQNQCLNSDGVFILEHNPKSNFNNVPQLIDVRNYGTTYFSFFKNL